jgi:hypothetical protein
MAHQTIFICDGCGSYVNINDLHNLVITINASTSVYNSKRTDGPRRREICRTCAANIFDQFKLGVNDDDVTREAFANFALPLKELSEPTT